MLEPVETAMFNAFDAAHAAQWKALRARFYADNEEVKAATVGSGAGLPRLTAFDRPERRAARCDWRQGRAWEWDGTLEKLWVGRPTAACLQLTSGLADRSTRTHLSANGSA
jgi:hypothetical protein